MNFHFARLCGLLPLVLAAGCAHLPERAELPAAARNQIASTDAVFVVPQHEIYVFVPNSNVGAATGGGLIGALIDVGINSVRTEKAEAAVKPLRDATVDYNFDAMFQDRLKAKLGEVSWLHVDGTKLVKDGSKQNIDPLITDSKDAAVLFVAADYQLSNDAAILTSSWNVSLFPHDEALRKLQPPADTKTPSAPANAIYRQKFYAKAVIPGLVPDDRDHNIKLWAADHGKPVRDALERGVDEMSKSLTDSLNGAPAPAAPAVASQPSTPQL